MSLSSIITSLTDQVSDVLGDGWQELNYIYSLEDNTFRAGNKRYGVGTRSGGNVLGVNNAITYDFEFFITLTESYVNRSNDVKEREALIDIYDNFDTLNVAIFEKKLNNPSVLVVQDIAFEEPERVDDGTIAVTCSFVIKYRKTT